MNTVTLQQQVFDEWMANHQGIIVKIVRSFTTRAADSEDLTQDIMLAIWRSISSFRGDAKPSTWIWRIALNQAISWQRATGDEQVDLAAVRSATRDVAADGLLVDRIYEAIRSLAPIDRSLIMLSLDGFSYAETSNITGLTETNVGARLTRARTRLTQLLEDAQ